MSESALTYVKLANLKRRYCALVDSGPADTAELEAARLEKIAEFEREFKVRFIPQKNWQT